MLCCAGDFQPDAVHYLRMAEKVVAQPDVD